LPAIIIGGTTVAGSSIWPLGLPIAGRRVLELGARYRRPHWLLCRSRLRGDRVSQLIEAVGLAFAITALITFGLANITPRRRRQSVRRSKSPGGSAVKSAAR
jgi:hypothetical protein